jgi:FtsH-binding integral membrane protein
VTTVLDSAASRSRSPSGSPGLLVLAVMGWITVVLLLDANGSRGLQLVLGALTWVALALVLWREKPLVRIQALVVVAFATAVEYTFSPVLEVYIYRFHNVPSYVPPGHGLVYLAALSVGRMALVRAQTSLCAAVALAAVGGWAVSGVVLADRPDVLGLFWFLCLAGFVLWGPSRGLYVGAALVVSYLEIVGTSLGTWSWQPYDPTGLVSIGNPPSGAAGGYGWFDLAALLLAPPVLAWWQRRRAGHQPSVVSLDASVAPTQEAQA